MTRPILFRGKNKDNIWINGDLIHRKTWNTNLCIIRSEDNGFELFEEHEVIPETVGQYFGKEDKNRVKIFEGDIVVCTRMHDSNLDVWKDENGKTVSKKFVIEHDGIDWVVPLDLKENSEFWEVIGNKFDNPELID